MYENEGYLSVRARNIYQARGLENGFEVTRITRDVGACGNQLRIVVDGIPDMANSRVFEVMRLLCRKIAPARDLGS